MSSCQSVESPNKSKSRDIDSSSYCNIRFLQTFQFWISIFNHLLCISVRKWTFFQSSAAFSYRVTKNKLKPIKFFHPSSNTPMGVNTKMYFSDNFQTLDLDRCFHLKMFIYWSPCKMICYSWKGGRGLRGCLLSPYYILLLHPTHKVSIIWSTAARANLFWDALLNKLLRKSP